VLRIIAYVGNVPARVAEQVQLVPGGRFGLSKLNAIQMNNLKLKTLHGGCLSCGTFIVAAQVACGVLVRGLGFGCPAYDKTIFVQHYFSDFQ
jgi:hypothetical protein